MLKLSFLALSFVAMFTYVNAQVFSDAEFFTANYCEPAENNTDFHGNVFKFIYAGENNDSTFLAKYNQQGQLQWKRLVSSYEMEQLTVDSFGNVYFIATESGYQDPVFIKYSSSGALLWKVNGEVVAGQEGYLFFQALATDDQGSLIVSGTITGTHRIGEIELYNAWDLYQDAVFILRFNPDGTIAFSSTSANYSPNSYVNSVVVDERNDIYVYGVFTGLAELENHTFLPVGDPDYLESGDYFVAKFDNTGELIWINQAGTEFADMGNGQICIDDAGNLHISGTVPLYDPMSSAYFGDNLLRSDSPGDYGFHAVVDQKKAPKIIYRVNAGGPEVADTNMNWAHDTQLAPISFLDPSSSNHTTGTYYAWTGENNTGIPDAIFGPNRYQISWGGPLAYHFPVNNGSYLLNLYFAEKGDSAGVNGPGQRIFDVMLENKLALKGLDIYQEVGLGALKKSILLTVHDEMLDIEFVRNLRNPQINGIEIISLNSKDAVTDIGIVTGNFHSAKQPENVIIKYYNNTLTVDFVETGLIESEVLITDQIGRVVYREAKQVKESLHVPVHFLVSGMYLVRVNGVSYKFLKQ